MLGLVTLMNLRGTKEAGWAFALPTYLFLGSLGSVIVLGTGEDDCRRRPSDARRAAGLVAALRPSRSASGCCCGRLPPAAPP